MINFTGLAPKDLKTSKEAENWLERVAKGLFRNLRTKRMYLYALDSDPDDPIANSGVLWQSDGTGSGGSGDILMKINNGTSIKTVTIVDFSTA